MYWSLSIDSSSGVIDGGAEVARDFDEGFGTGGDHVGLITI